MNSFLPKVSVCLTAYNIEKYVAQALDSVLNQRTNFDFELIIGEDKSSDNTVGVLEDYRIRYPEKIRIISNEKNLGMMGNFIKTLESSKSKYIAVLDGDDYWTDNTKLQKQFDVMEKNDEYSLCWHDAIIVNSTGDLISSFALRFNGRDYFNTFDLYKVVQWKVLGATSSIFFRNVISPFPDWAYNLYGTEALLFLRCGQVGILHYISEPLSAYRIHSSSMESSFTKVSKAKRNINEESILYNALYPKFRSHFLRKILWNTFYLTLISIRKHDLKGAVSSFASLPVVVCKYLFYKLFDR